MLRQRLRHRSPDRDPAVTPARRQIGVMGTLAWVVVAGALLACGDQHAEPPEVTPQATPSPPAATVSDLRGDIVDMAGQPRPDAPRFLDLLAARASRDSSRFLLEFEVAEAIPATVAESRILAYVFFLDTNSDGWADLRVALDTWPDGLHVGFARIADLELFLDDQFPGSFEVRGRKGLISLDVPPADVRERFAWCMAAEWLEGLPGASQAVFRDLLPADAWPDGGGWLEGAGQYSR